MSPRRVARQGGLAATRRDGPASLPVAPFSRNLNRQNVQKEPSEPTYSVHLGLLAAGVGPGDEVIVPSFTFAATANSVALTGATPVFVDIEPDTLNMDATQEPMSVHERTLILDNYK